MEHLLSLLYISNALPSQSEQDVAEILEVSRSNNLKAGITGILCSGGEHFIQVLEGPQQAVLESYLRIMNDSRHTDCFLIGMTQLRKRNFEQWSMGHVNISQEKILERRRLLMSHWKHQVRETDLVDLMRHFLSDTVH